MEFSEGQNAVKSKSDSAEALKGIFQLDVFMLNINFLTYCWFDCCAVQKATANTPSEVGIVSICFFVGEKKRLNHFYIARKKISKKRQTYFTFGQEIKSGKFQLQLVNFGNLQAMEKRGKEFV